MNEYGYLLFDVCLLYIGCMFGTNIRLFWIFLELWNLTKYELLHRLLKKFNGCFLIMNSFKVCWLNSSIADSLVKISGVKVRWSDHSAKYHSCVFSCFRSTSTFMYSSLLFFNVFFVASLCFHWLMLEKMGKENKEYDNQNESNKTFYLIIILQIWTNMDICNLMYLCCMFDGCLGHF